MVHIKKKILKKKKNGPCKIAAENLFLFYISKHFLTVFYSSIGITI